MILIMCRWMLIAAVGLLLLGCQPANLPYLEVTVQQVISGQELQVSGLEHYPEITERVRLLGLVAPAANQRPWGRDAQQWLTATLQGQTLQLEMDRQVHDDQGRRLAYVWLAGRLMNEQLIAAGQAIAQPDGSNQKYQQRFAHAEAKARLLGLGIWNPDRPLRHNPQGEG
jgi:micrococcal nuclease